MSKPRPAAEIILFITDTGTRVVNPGLSDRAARINDELARRVKPGIRAIEAALRSARIPEEAH